MIALLRRFIADSLWLGLSAVAGIVLFESLLMRALSDIKMDALLALGKIPFVSQIWKAMLGSDLLGMISGTGLATIGVAHPLLYLVAASVLLTECTRVIVGEIDRGSADVLLSLPTTRAKIYISSSLVWAGWGFLICAAALAGLRVGLLFSSLYEPVDFTRIVPVLPNMYLLYLSIGGLAMGVSSFMVRRGRAIAIVLAYLLASFVANFLAQLWPPMQALAHWGVLNHYQPLQQVYGGAVPWSDLTFLAGVGAVGWTVGLVRYTRRDIPA